MLIPVTFWYQKHFRSLNATKLISAAYGCYTVIGKHRCTCVVIVSIVILVIDYACLLLNDFVSDITIIRYAVNMT